MKDCGQGSCRPVAESEAFESSGQAFARTACYVQRRGTCDNDVNWDVLCGGGDPIAL